MRDIKDSERIRTAIVKSLKQPQHQTTLGMNLANLNTCILSKGYWEQMQLDQNDSGSAANDFAPPTFLKKAFDDFASKY